MTRYELFTCNQTLITAMVENGIDPKDIKYLPLINEYKEMKSKHHKVGYIVYHLSVKYEMSERAVYNVVNRMTKRVKI